MFVWLHLRLARLHGQVAAIAAGDGSTMLLPSLLIVPLPVFGNDVIVCRLPDI